MVGLVNRKSHVASLRSNDRRQLLRDFARLSAWAFATMPWLTLSPNYGICQADEEREFFEVARPIFSKSDSVSVFSLTERLYAGAADLTLEKIPTYPSKELNSSSRSFLLSTLNNSSSYLFGVRKATRFFADSGLIFEGYVPKNVFLLSTDFRGGRLVLERPLNPRLFIVNLDPVFPQILEQLSR
jgi:hypothetical protein